MTGKPATEPAWVPEFLAALARTRIVARALEAAGITANAVYIRRRTNLQFAEGWKAALKGEILPPPEPQAARNAGWKVLFLEALAESSNVTAAAIEANTPLRTVYRTRRKDPAFADRWLTALREGYDHLEMELLGHLRDPQPSRKMDVAVALRLLAAHRETVERSRALAEEEDEQAVLDSIDRFIEDIRDRRAANTALLEAGDGAE